ncbi:MAG: HAD family hydrolase [Clostridiales bacterium]|nr:HAD family hydrolase [Clostridiales bacterium]
MYKLVVFDLDGTLLDTLDDLTASTNAALRLHGFPTRNREEVRSFIGDGIVKLLERSVGIENYPRITEMVADFRAYYGAHCKDETKPYTGVMDVLQALRQRGVKLAVLSNKVHAATQALIADYFPDVFDEVMGENEAAGIKRKPSPIALLKILEKQGVEKAETAYVGDSEVDIQTARNAGVDCVSVTWGFKEESFLKEQGANRIARTANELLEKLLN